MKVLIFIFIGIVCGLLTVFIIPASLEIVVWFALILGMGFAIGRDRQYDSVFWPGVGNSVLVGVSITATHLLFLRRYVIGHQEELQFMKSLTGIESGLWNVVIFAPVYWMILGVLGGFSALIWRNLSK
jgi:hypothetical protein